MMVRIKYDQLYDDTYMILIPFLKVAYSRKKFCFKKIYFSYFQCIFY